MSVALPTGSRDYIVPANAVRGIQRGTRELIEAFESRRAPLADPVALVQFGQALRDTFLAPVYDELRAAIVAGTTRLLFHSPEPALLNLPWELLPDGEAQFLVADARCAIRRAAREKLAPPSLPLAASPLRILFAACAPIDQVGLDFEKEEDAILRIAHQLGARMHLDIAEAGTFDELRDLITEHEPHIVHLSGHGSVREGVGSFAFEDERGRTDSRDARQMAELLFAGRGVRLVFVNGCQTSQAAIAGVCQTLTATGHVPLALGWGASIADHLATEFARVFFHEVATQPVDLAVASARRALLEKCRVKLGALELLDASFALPQLYAGESAESLVDHHLSPDVPDRPGVRYELLGDNIRGLREGFVGRRRVLQHLRPALRSGEKTVVLLTGIGGAGKSTLATRLANRCALEGYRVVAVRAERNSPTSFGLRIVSELATACQRLGQKADEDVLQDGNRPLANRLRLAVEVLNERKLLLVLDNLESLMPEPPAAPVWLDPDFAGFFHDLVSRLTGQGRALLTCRYLPAGFDPEQPNLAHEAMPDFTEADFFKYLRRHSGVADRMDKGELPRDLLTAFHRKLGATPRFVEQASAILSTLEPDRIAEQLERVETPEAGAGDDELWQLQQAYFRDLFLPQLYNALPANSRLALSRLAVVHEAIPLDGVARVLGQNDVSTLQMVNRCLRLSLLQRFGETGQVDLFAVYPLQRDFFTAAERLPDEDRNAAHRAAAVFFRECYEKDRESELGLSFMAELQACLHHAGKAGDLDQRIWATAKLAWPMIRRAEFGAARNLVDPLLAEQRHPDLLQIAARCASDTGEWPNARKLTEEEQKARQAISDRAGEAGTWHNLASIDLNEGHYAAARDNFAKSLAIKQAIGDRAGEAGTWHQLATLDLNEGNHAAARDNFAKSLAIKQAIGDRAGEAATWHNLATIDLKEGNYAAARDNFAKALAMLQAIGDRAGEAATWHQLATIDLHEGNYAAARDNFAKALAMRQAIGDRAGEAATWHNLASIDLNEGNYAAARDNFAKSLAIKQAIGDRAGEAATWHNLATIDLKEGNYAAARDNFAKSLAIKQAIGDRAGEARTYGQIGATAWKLEQQVPAARLMAMSFLLLNAIGAVEKTTAWSNLTHIASTLGLDQTAFDTLLQEADEHYQRDRGAELIRQAFANLPDTQPPSTPPSP